MIFGLDLYEMALEGAGVKKTDKVWTAVFIFLIWRVFLQAKK